MFAQVLKAQWLQGRAIVILFLLLAFTVPLGSAFYGGDVHTTSVENVAAWLSMSKTVGQVIPILALSLGVLMGMAAWAPDHAGRHVYALSLPVSRAQFVLLRFAAGVTLLAIPVAGLGLGAILATYAVKLPSGIHAYPLQLTLRFALSATVMFAIFFAISIGTKRAVVATLGVVGGLLTADLLRAALGDDPVVVSWVYGILTTWPGPLAILLGRWALFDV
jgi:hypothetical protein